VTDRSVKPCAAPSRWQGGLTPEQKPWSEANEIARAYDPMQIGWVIADDAAFCPKASAATPLSWKGNAVRRLGFRRWQSDDLRPYMRLLGDPEVWHFMHEVRPGDMAEALARGLIGISARHAHHDVLAATLDGEAVGQMRLAFGTDPGSRDTAETSYWLGRVHWERGLGRDLLRAATARAFADHPWLSRLVAFVHPENRASERALRGADYHDRGHRDDGSSCFVISREG